MICSRCATELASNATFCPKCGLSISTMQSQSTRYSYLPAGTPPWPTSVPAQIPYVVDSKASTVVAAPVAKPAQKTGSKVLVSVACLLLVPLLGAFITLGVLAANGQVGARPAPTPSSNQNPLQAQPTTPAQQTPAALPTPASLKDTDTTVNNTLKASLKYPGDWQIAPLNQSSSFVGYAVYSQQRSIEVHIQRFTAQVSAQVANAEDLNQQIIQSLTQSYTSVQTVPPANANPTIGGVAWTEGDATFVDPQNMQGSQLHFAVITTKHGDVYYSFILFVPNNIYQDAMQTYIQPIFDSFQFLD